MYTRVFTKILDSSINVQSVPPTARWLFITMLLIADADRTGTVNMPLERLAARAGLSVEDTQQALNLLSSPDPDSDSKVSEGRRITPMPDGQRGWVVVNWERYRKIGREEERREQVRVAVARHRGRLTDGSNQPVINGNTSEAASKAPAKAKESSRRIFADDSMELRAARYLFDKIRANNPTAKKPNWQSWARDFDLIFRIDKRDPAGVAALIDFAETDPFWLKNVLSPRTLRKQFDRLTLASKAPRSGAKPFNRADPVV